MKGTESSLGGGGEMFLVVMLFLQGASKGDKEAAVSPGDTHRPAGDTHYPKSLPCGVHQSTDPLWDEAAMGTGMW